ncbi:MAG: menaquinone biosynthesis protein [Acidobacteria bacterium]|nr:menaquinone biosynthesis protein [Acidobacteriota bacterium]
MEKLRISIVEYLNTAPLVWGFTDGPQRGKYELEFTVPSQCAEALRQGTADVAIIPAVEYQRMDHVVVLPGMAVAAKGPVRSILVIAKKPIELAKKVALDTSSRSSQALVRLLCRERWGISPEFVPAAPEPTAMLDQADAALVIGDPALRVAVKMDELAARRASDGTCCGGDPNDLPVPGHESLFVYDVAHEWREMTGLPCVLAIWVARRGVVTPEVMADFVASKEYGMARLPEIAEGAEAKLKMPADALENYLRNNIDFSLDEENLAGLELYFRKCAEAGLIARAKAVEFVEVESEKKGVGFRVQGAEER